MNFANRRIVVVGASGVLGGLIVDALIERGAEVWATASTMASAERINPNVKQRVLLDLANQTSVDAASAYFKQNGEYDGIVIAAGLVGFGSAAEMPIDAAERLARVNYLGPANFIAQLAPSLRSLAGGGSFVAAITGVVAAKVFPGMSAYTASKWAMRGWLDSFRLETKSKGVTVIEVRPGHTETGLAGRAIHGTAPAMPTGMQPAHVANRIIAAIEAGETVVGDDQF